jgi:hypothetical protein
MGNKGVEGTTRGMIRATGVVVLSKWWYKGSRPENNNDTGIEGCDDHRTIEDDMSMAMAISNIASLDHVVMVMEWRKVKRCCGRWRRKIAML